MRFKVLCPEYFQDGVCYSQGQTVESLMNLVEVHGSDCFERLADSDPQDLKKLTVPQLRALAEERGVDLGDAELKSDIIAVIEGVSV